MFSKSHADGAILDSSPSEYPTPLSRFTAGGEMGKPEWAQKAKPWGGLEPLGMRREQDVTHETRNRSYNPEVSVRAGERSGLEDKEPRKRRSGTHRGSSPEFPWLRRTEENSEYAAGAWAARREIAALIDMGVRRSSIKRLVEDHKEEGSPLRHSFPDAEENRPRSSGRRRGRDRTRDRGRSRTRHGEHSVPKEETIARRSEKGMSLARSHASEIASEYGLGAASRGALGSIPGSMGGFRKPAKQPQLSPSPARSPAGDRDDKIKEGSFFSDESVDSRMERDQSEEHPLTRFPEVSSIAEGFKKKAEIPAPEEKGNTPVPEEPRILKKLPMRKDPRTADIYDQYDKATRELFEELVLWEVKMDMVELVFYDGQLDEARFGLLTDPRSPSTGLRYARLLKRFLLWVSSQGKYGELKPITAAYLGGFVELLISTNTGHNTPRSFLFALEYFSVLFGYVTPKIELRRWKKMGDGYAANAPPRQPAPHLNVDLLGYLESVVLDRSRATAERLTAGKLRLCVQASIRHSDLTSTPLGLIEWCRYRGTCRTLGIRAKAPVTKSGPRLWAASHLGVSKEGDGWLAALMDMILESHGPGWRDHEFCGCAVAGGSFAAYPSTIEADTAVVRSMMLRDVEADLAPMTKTEASHFRWHGAKSTMPTYMGHLGICTKATGFQGAWKKPSEAMPDLYLREAQVLVIQSQIETLDRLRKGIELRLLEGRPLGEIAKDIPFCQPGDEGQTNWKIPVAEGESREAPESTVEAMKRCGACEPWEDGELLPPPALCPDARELRRELADAAVADDEKHKENLYEEASVPIPHDVRDSMIEENPQDEESSSDDGEKEAVDLEMFTAFVSLRSGSGKIHRPAADLERGPMCGVPSRNYSSLRAEDAWDPDYELCSRCFGKSFGCRKMCSHTSRCGRRCANKCEEADASEAGHEVSPHLCSFHG